MICVFRCAPRASSLAALVLLACAPGVAEPPHVSLQHLRRAVEAGDTATALQYIDPEAVVSRLVRDLLAAVRDSLHIPLDDTLDATFRARVDSLERQLVGVLRAQLGLAPFASAEGDTSTGANEGIDEPWSDSYPGEDVLAEAVEIVGDGRARYVGDTALVDRVLRYAHLDTTATLRLALVPVEGSRWRIVAFHNAVALGRSLHQRQLAILERANERLRDSIYARVSIRDLAISREPLAEWGQYVAEVHATVENESTDSLVLRAAYLVGPRLALEDTVAQLLERPLRLGPERSSTIVWRHDLRTDQWGLHDLVSQPDLYGIEIGDVEWGGRASARIQLYRTWRDYVERNPLPTPTSGGVLAHTPVWGASQRLRACRFGPASFDG